MESIQNELKTIFYSFDSDGDGCLTQEQVVEVMKQLGIEVKPYNMDKKMKVLDRLSKGLVNFDDFQIWHQYEITNKLKYPVKLRMHLLKMYNKIQQSIVKHGGLVWDQPQTETSQHFISLNIGDAPPLSYLQLNILNGKQHQDFSKQLLDCFNLSDNIPAVIMTLKVNDSNKAKEQFENVFEQVIAMITAFAPPQYADLVLEHLQIQYNTPTPDSLKISISSNHPLLLIIIDELLQFLESILPMELSQSVNISASGSYTFKDFLQNVDQYMGTFNCYGLSASFDAQLSKEVISKMRNKYLSLMDKDNEKFSARVLKVFNKMAPISYLVFLDGSKVSLNFKSFDQCSDDIGDVIGLKEDLKGMGNLNELLAEVKDRGDKKIASFLEEMPIIQDILDAFQQNVQGELSLTFQIPKVSVTLTVQTEGFGELVQHVMSKII